MSHVPKTTNPINWLFPVIFLAIIAVAALYIVRNNFNEREPSSDYTNKDTRSDFRDTMLKTVRYDSSNMPKATNDSLINHRQRESQPEADTTK